jgi:hypothetical protein
VLRLLSIKKISAWLLLLVTAGCITPYEPEFKEQPANLVVQGFVSNEPGPYIIQLVRPANYSFSGYNISINNAKVTISDGQGRVETLFSRGSGQYQTQSLRGEVGQTYQLHIEVNGKKYRSRPETIRPVSKIDRVYDKTFRGIDPLTNKDVLGGWRVYIDSKDPAEQGNYYRWSWKHYRQSVFCGSAKDRFGNPQYGLFCCTSCWDIVRCSGPGCISVGSDALINGKSIAGKLVAEVPVGCPDRYYLEIEQHSLSRDAYLYWSTVNRMLQNTGGVFDAAPSAIPGNLTSLTDQDEEVMGFFGAYGIERVGYFVDRRFAERTSCRQDLPYPPTGGIPPPCVACTESLDQTGTRPRFWDN